MFSGTILIINYDIIQIKGDGGYYTCIPDKNTRIAEKYIYHNTVIGFCLPIRREENVTGK